MSAMETDLYEVLGVARDADGATIKSAYRRLAMQHHPDRNAGCKDNEDKFKAVSAAYECLKDPQKRAAYDRYGHAAFQGGSIARRHSMSKFRRVSTPAPAFACPERAKRVRAARPLATYTFSSTSAR